MLLQKWNSHITHPLNLQNILIADLGHLPLVHMIHDIFENMPFHINLAIIYIIFIIIIIKMTDKETVVKSIMLQN